MNELLLNVKSQLIYVLENQLKLKPENFIKEFGTPDNPDHLDSYYNLISDKIVLILTDNYDFIKTKSQSLLDKLPGVNDLEKDEREQVNLKLNHFINEELPVILLSKFSNTLFD